VGSGAGSGGSCASGFDEFRAQLCDAFEKGFVIIGHGGSDPIQLRETSSAAALSVAEARARV
jgi:hypothetical protein